MHCLADHVPVLLDNDTDLCSVKDMLVVIIDSEVDDCSIKYNCSQVQTFFTIFDDQIVGRMCRFSGVCLSAMTEIAAFCSSEIGLKPTSEQFRSLQVVRKKLKEPEQGTEHASLLVWHAYAIFNRLSCSHR